MSDVMRTVLFGCLIAAAFSAAGIEIRGANFANWFIAGEPVLFRAKETLPESAKVAVAVFDSAGKTAVRQELSGAVFNREGWRWNAPRPGFYEAEFKVDGETVSEHYPVGIRRQDPVDKRKYTFVGKRDFAVSRHAFAVAPAKTADPADISPHFGASPHFSMYKNAIPLARLIGFHSIRIHALRWDSMEKEPGKINWSGVDDFLRLARENGFPDERITFNIYGTPRWASSRPEADWINIFVPEYAAVTPKNLDDWRNFIRQVMRRYPKIGRYELWNEPHLIGFTCFWVDSTRNFVDLLKAGYETVKAEKPEATVWLGGIGMRYLPFYDEFLKLGGGRYYDVLPLHGSWVRPEPFHELEKKYGLEPKPVVSSEWHAMLLKPYAQDFPGEQLLARNMVLDFLNQIRAGVTEVDFFCILNLYRTEKETLQFHRENRSYDTHVSGLFRQVPYIQPRYPALAWQVFTAQVKGKLKVGSGYLFDNNTQRALMLESDSGPMLMVWNTGGKAAPAAPELRSAVGPDSRILTAEGAELERGAPLTLEPEVYYFVRDPDPAAVAAWRNTGEVLYAQNAKLTLQNKLNGVYRRGALFDADMNPVFPQKIAWQPVAERVVNNPALAPGETKGRFAAGFTSAGLELLVEVEDPVHVMKADNGKVWEFDSLQFALDTKGEGFDVDRIEFAAALGEDGKPVLWKVYAPNLAGDLPARYTPAGERVRNGRCRIERKDGRTVYRIAVDASELYPFSLEQQPRVRFSLLVNNNDGKGRAAWIEWGSGIGGVKDPCRYGNLTPALPPGPLASQQQLKNKGWNKDYELEFRNENGIPSVKVGSSPLCAGVSSGWFGVVPGAVYRVRFEARGDARLQVLASGSAVKRLDLLPPTPLGAGWEAFDLPFYVPKECRGLSVTCFAWRQPGRTFEIRNFTVEPFRQ